MEPAQFAEHAAEQPRRPGEYEGTCDQCGCPIWVDDHPGPLAALRMRVGGEMEQTGGMCSALRIDLPDSTCLYATALDGPLIIGHCRDAEALYEGDYLDFEEFGEEDEDPTAEDIDAAAAYVRGFQ
jgi:hypothetical protein